MNTCHTAENRTPYLPTPNVTTSHWTRRRLEIVGKLAIEFSAMSGLPKKVREALRLIGNECELCALDLALNDKLQTLDARN
jgi:hypothetical protein